MPETITIPPRRSKGECEIEIDSGNSVDFLAYHIAKAFIHHLGEYQLLANKAINYHINLAEDVFNEIEEDYPAVALAVLGWGFAQATREPHETNVVDQLLNKLFAISKLNIDPDDMPNTNKLRNFVRSR